MSVIALVAACGSSRVDDGLPSSVPRHVREALVAARSLASSPKVQAICEDVVATLVCPARYPDKPVNHEALGTTALDGNLAVAYFTVTCEVTQRTVGGASCPLRDPLGKPCKRYSSALAPGFTELVDGESGAAVDLLTDGDEPPGCTNDFPFFVRVSEKIPRSPKNPGFVSQYVVVEAMVAAEPNGSSSAAP